MKPRDFDELVRQKFDQNEFEYNPGNWSKLEEQLDGRAKKRSLLMMWWMPAMGVAASVALAIGITTMVKMDDGTVARNGRQPVASAQVAQPATGWAKGAATAPAPTEANNNTTGADAHSAPVKPILAAAHTNKKNTQKHNKKTAAPLPETSGNNGFAIVYENAIGKATPAPVKTFNLNVRPETLAAINKKKNEQPVAEPVKTFKAEDAVVRKAPKLSVILSGGMAKGSMNSGYTAGATIRRMINEKVYVEGDIAFTTSSNTQSKQFAVTDGATGAGGVTAGKQGFTAAKNANVESSKSSITTAPAEIIKTQNVSYDLYYAQVTPSIGCKIMKKLSIGAGPDFQKALVDNRPAPSTVDRGTIQEAPLFDIGMMGKTEYALNKRVQAAVLYRKGINNILTPMGKYIDRDYVQFQVRCTIFNK